MNDANLAYEADVKAMLDRIKQLADSGLINKQHTVE